MKFPELIEKIIKRIKYEFFDKYRYFLGSQKYKEVLNAGERYDPNIGNMVNWHDPCHPARYEFAKNYTSKQDLVLDIACGTGYGTVMMASVCREIIGVDISESAIKYAKAKNNRQNTKFIISDFFQNKIIADIVVSFETIEHLKVHHIEEILKPLIGFSTQKIIGSVPYEEKPGDNQYHYLFNLNESSFQYLNNFGTIDFYYQAIDGEIYSKNPENIFIQNLIFVFEKSNNQMN